MDARERRNIVLRLAARMGFDHCGIAPAEPIPRAEYVRAWLARGRAGTMQYLHRHLDVRLDPRKLLEGARSVIVVAVNYHQPEPYSREAPDTRTPSDAVPQGPSTPRGQTRPDDSSCDSMMPRRRGKIARYAWGEDYHVVVGDRLRAMVDALRDALAKPFRFRICVDTVPLLERELAARAGVGWIGKNTMVLNRRLGSYFFLGEIVTDLDLAPGEPVADHCGSCTACLDACPTGAFPAPYEMDAARCISYLTIEHRGPIDDKLAALSGDWLFGCDVCQEVCPYNREAPSTIDPRFAVRPPAPSFDPRDVLNWTPEDYRRHLRGRAMKRAKLDMLQRNARMVMDNTSRAAGTP